MPRPHRKKLSNCCITKMPLLLPSNKSCCWPVDTARKLTFLELVFSHYLVKENMSHGWDTETRLEVTSATCRSSLCSNDGISCLWDICKQSLTEKKDNKETRNIHDTNVFQPLCSRMAFTEAAAAFNINALILLKVGALGSSFPSFWWTFSPNVIKQLSVSAVFWKYCLNNRKMEATLVSDSHT